MATDALLSLQPSVTKTSTFQGNWLTLRGGTPVRGLWVRVIYSAASNASGSNTVTWSIERSPDGGSTAYLLTDGAQEAITLSTSAQSGEFWLPVATSDTSVRLVVTIDGVGSTPTVTYQGAIEATPPRAALRPRGG